jgi:hypothetical protein
MFFEAGHLANPTFCFPLFIIPATLPRDKESYSNTNHVVLAFQPTTAFPIFMQTINDQDVATGFISLGNGCDNEAYQMHGPSSVFNIKNVIPPSNPTLGIVEE